MIKTILVPATGNQTDDAVFTSALAAARVFNAHLDFLHVRVDAAAMVAAMATDGSGAAMVSGLIERIDEEATQREDAAGQLFQRFCERERLAIEDTPAGRQSPTAQWLRQTGDEAYWVREYGRAADLLVVGRPADDEGVSLDTIEAALVGSGRPVLVVPAAPLVSLPETIVIAWKAAPEAARAVTAAMPFLSKAKQILIVTVAEEEGLSDEEGARLMTSLAWHGLNAAAAEQSALVVMGAYGHSRLREWIFGGFTEHVLRGAAVPVLMMH
jgi:nucleotide-binding universal stress UspA family protein